MTIDQFCEDLKDRLGRRNDGDAHEIATAIMDVVEPPTGNHTSDCATSCAPAHMPGWCDCGAVNREAKRA